MEQKELFPSDNKFISLNEVSEILSISTATARNWIKSGKIQPRQSSGREMLFLRDDIELLLDNIKKGKESRLKSRRNKKHITGTFIPKTYIQSKAGIEIVENIISQIDSLELPDDYERIILAEYVLKLFASRKMIKMNLKSEECFLLEYIRNNEISGCYSKLIEDIISDTSEIETKISKLKSALCYTVDFIEDQDFLGLLSMSLQSIGSRKSNGVYYTPLAVVKDAVDNLKQINEKTKLLDPCCGTGNFLMYAYKYIHNLEQIYGYDISPMSVYLTRVNMALITKTENIEVLYKNFICKDTLRDNNISGFDVVIGNPPWGFKYDLEEEFLRENYLSAQAKTVESFCVFTEYALKAITQNGSVSLILPQSLLNVKIHQQIRDYLWNNSNVKRIRYWENIFDNVQCPAMTLTFEKSSTGFNLRGMEVVTDKRTFIVGEKARNLDKTNWYFDITDEEVMLIEKIETSVEVAYLKYDAEFALGIVTGDNSKYVSDFKFEGSEIILRGNEVFKYRFVPSNNFIKFEPENFQQVAPTELYRADEKLIYRFICDSLVFAYDNSQTLTLNSANIVIPRIEGLTIKYIMAILNSRVIHYYFKHIYKSVKILRKHIEDLPIPVVNSDIQFEITKKVDKLLTSANSSDISLMYEAIDIDVAKLFCLAEEDYEIIKTETSQYNLFLLGK